MARLGPVEGGRGRRGRRFESRRLRKRFLIVCEGEVTEVRYFEAFPVPADVRVTVKGEGKNTMSLVAAAIVHADAGEYDEVWVVYDHDDFPDDRFNAAEAEIRGLSRRRRETWCAAWSHQAFEVWYLLHFQLFDGRLHRHVVQKKVGERLVEQLQRRATARTIRTFIECSCSRARSSRCSHAETAGQAARRSRPTGARRRRGANPCTHGLSAGQMRSMIRSMAAQARALWKTTEGVLSYDHAGVRAIAADPGLTGPGTATKPSLA
jgi:hypothetical protein